MPLSKQANAKHSAKMRSEANANEGDINAQYNLACLYLRGEGCEQNSVEAQKWFEVAANQGDADAQFNLGIMLHEARDAASAFRWFKEAATQGNPWAQDNFNLMSGTGELSQELHTTFIYNHRKEKGSGGARPRSGGARPRSGRMNAEKRLWNTIDARRSQLLPPKSLLVLGSTECTCATYSFCPYCPPEKKQEAEESCRQLRCLLHGSTSDFMTMDHSENDTLDLIEKFINVPDGRKDQLQRDWETIHMPVDKTLPACAACGIRDPDSTYHLHDVLTLPAFCKLDEQALKELEAIGTIRLVFRLDGDSPCYFFKETDI